MLTQPAGKRNPVVPLKKSDSSAPHDNLETGSILQFMAVKSRPYARFVKKTSDLNEAVTLNGKILKTDLLWFSATTTIRTAVHVPRSKSSPPQSCLSSHSFETACSLSHSHVASGRSSSHPQRQHRTGQPRPISPPSLSLLLALAADAPPRNLLHQYAQPWPDDVGNQHSQVGNDHAFRAQAYDVAQSSQCCSRRSLPWMYHSAPSDLTMPHSGTQGYHWTLFLWIGSVSMSACWWCLSYHQIQGAPASKQERIFRYSSCFSFEFSCEFVSSCLNLASED